MFRKKKSKRERPEFPHDLNALGYKIDDEEQRLRTINGELYVFEVKDRAYNEALYDKLVELVSEYVEEQLRSKYNMVKMILPIGTSEEAVHTKIYVSSDYLTKESMIVFIPGLSNKFGIWAKRSMTEHGVKDGSVLSYTERAMNMGFSVVVTNPNEIYWHKNKPTATKTPYVTVPENDSPEVHVDYVFRHFVIPSAAQNIFVVANSYGGYSFVEVMQKHFSELKDRVKAVDFTSSTHSIDAVKSYKVKNWIREHCRNWVVSDKKLGEEVIDPRFGCVNYSGGDDLIEYLLRTCESETFSYFHQRLTAPSPSSDSYVEPEDISETELLREAEAILQQGGVEIQSWAAHVDEDGWGEEPKIQNGAQVATGQPLDTVKVRMQVYPHRYKNPFDCIVRTVREESIFALYKGMASPLIGIGAVNALLFAAYSKFKQIQNPFNDELEIWQIALAGAGAGAVNSVLASPVELLKVRLQAQYTPLSASAPPTLKQYKGPVELASHLVSTHGIRHGLFRGFWATFLREIPAYAGFYAGFEYMKREFGGSHGKELGVGQLMAAGAVGGVCYWLSCYPLDVVKSMVQGSEKPLERFYVLKTLRSIYRQDGLRGFMRGISPTIVRTIPAAGATFTVYEFSMRALNKM
ncbi:1811_t:CDS:10 [Paraglomus occultum]|uniref:1811_t:CDS:1 n=1 Tax=Paraglomus occultum TaxID=144539 RepID=A0A9N9FZH7_9GLOM|nr:1811_t:CDS:10 [Paraglomus occultum]